MTPRQAIIELAACPSCCSLPGEPCRTIQAGGRKVRNHPQRVHAALRDSLGWLEREQQKQASRDEDARRLAAGEVTREELTRENSMFPPGTKFRITNYGGPPAKRRKP